MKKVISSLGVLMLLAGCQSAPAGTLLGNASVTVRPRIVVAERSTQAVLTPYTDASIHHLTLKLFRMSGGTENEMASMDIAGPIGIKTVTFGNLAHTTNYRIRAVAYATAGKGSPISVDASSLLNFNVGIDDAITIPAVPVQLRYVTFSGSTGANNISVSPGTLIHAGNETIN